MEKYKASKSGYIRKYEVTKETDQTVWFKEAYGLPKKELIRQERKKSNYDAWFNTFDEAKQYLIDLHKANIISAQARIDYENNEIEKVYQLKEF